MKASPAKAESVREALERQIGEAPGFVGTALTKDPKEGWLVILLALPGSSLSERWRGKKIDDVGIRVLTSDRPSPA